MTMSGIFSDIWRDIQSEIKSNKHGKEGKELEKKEERQKGEKGKW